MPYEPSFIKGYTIPVPAILDTTTIAPLLNGNGHLINYHHHSVAMNKKRKFAYYSASNIDGKSWEPIDRSGSFLKDEKNIDASFQLGDELYSAIAGGRGRKNDFDEGHLTSFQEVLWGKSDDMQQAGSDTFFFTNCVPQHSLLNRGAWKSLEQYVTKKGADKENRAVSVFTGPLFNPKDPYFIKMVNGEFIRIPCTFWKVIFYKADNGPQAVGFMMNHEQLLLDEGTVTYDKGEVMVRDADDIFMSFPKATTYQVRVELIEQLTKFDFHLDGIGLPYQQNESKEIVYKRIEVVRKDEKDAEDFSFQNEPLDYRLDNLTL